ncbi:efflux RND transporter permease subunit, partial [Acinetobacter baumannii]
MARIPGVGQVMIRGAGDYSMRVWLDPEKIAERGLSASDVVTAIRNENVEAAGGALGATPTAEGVRTQLTVNVRGRLRNTEEFENIIVR